MWKVVDGRVKFVPVIRPYRRPALTPYDLRTGDTYSRIRRHATGEPEPEKEIEE